MVRTIGRLFPETDYCWAGNDVGSLAEAVLHMIGTTRNSGIRDGEVNPLIPFLSQLPAPSDAAWIMVRFVFVQLAGQAHARVAEPGCGACEPWGAEWPGPRP